MIVVVVDIFDDCHCYVDFCIVVAVVDLINWASSSLSLLSRS